MDSLQNNSSLVDLLNTFGKDGEFHKDVTKLKDSIDSLTKTLVGRAGGKKDTESEETDKSEEAPTKTLMGNLKDFGRGFKDSILGKKEMPIATKSSKALPVQDDGPNKVLSDMVDVLKIISEDKIQLKILSEISTIKNLFSNSADARTIEPNNETEKQEDREKLAEAIARRLSELDVFGGNTSADILGKGAAAAGLAGAAKFLGRAAVGTAAIYAGGQVVDATVGALGTNKDSNGKELPDIPKELDDIQGKELEILDPTYSKLGTFSRAQDWLHGFMGMSETKKAEVRQRTEKEYAMLDEKIKNLDKNTNITSDQKKKVFELEKQRQIILENILYEREKKDAATQTETPPQSTRSVEPTRTEPASSAAPESALVEPKQVHSKEAIEEEKLAEEATQKLRSKKSTPAKITPKEKDNIGMAESRDAEAAKKPLVEIKPVTNEEKPVPAGPDIVPAESSKSADQLSQMTGENSQLQENSRSLSAAPISITSNQSSSNDSTELDLEKITPYSNYGTFDRWQYSRSGDYDHA